MVGRAVSLMLIIALAGCAEPGFTEYGGKDGPQTYDHKSVGNTRDSFGYSLNAGNKSSMEQYDWETGAARAHVGISGHVQQGSVHLTIRDTARLVVYEATYTGSSSEGFTTDRGVIGEWTIELDFEGFTGSLSLGISANYGA